MFVQMQRAGLRAWPTPPMVPVMTTSPGFSVTMICEATPPSGEATMP
jgi:hypothetical protein